MSTEPTSPGRSDAKLKRLPIEALIELVARRAQPNVTAADLLKWLAAEHQVYSSQAALSRCWAWIEARVRSHIREQKIDEWMDNEKAEHPELSDEEIFRRGQRRMELITIAEEDPLLWKHVQTVRRDKETGVRDQIKLQRETCELFLKWDADKRAREIASSDVSHAEKIEQLGQLMFPETWKQ
jgi:hypothetical protein